MSQIEKRGISGVRGGVFLISSLAGFAAWSQDNPGTEPVPDFATANPAVPSIPVARPVAPTGPQTPSDGRAPLPPQSMPGASGTGAFAGFQGQARLIETEVPERVPVYPDDPESAWWEVNPHYAFDRAQREQRPLLLVFTGTWNAQAMSLSQEVFATKSFNEFVKENLVICYLNYPKNYTDAPQTLRRIKDKFKVKGYPNTLIFNPNGEVQKGITGYRTGRPIDYFNRLKAACLPVIESIETRNDELKKFGFRDWSNYLGKEIFARFIEHDTTHVIIQDASAQKWTVKINDLAPEDQKLVESFPAVDKLETETEEE